MERKGCFNSVQAEFLSDVVVNIARNGDSSLFSYKRPHKNEANDIAVEMINSYLENHGLSFTLATAFAETDGCFSRQQKDGWVENKLFLLSDEVLFPQLTKNSQQHQRKGERKIMQSRNDPFFEESIVESDDTISTTIDTFDPSPSNERSVINKLEKESYQSISKRSHQSRVKSRSIRIDNGEWLLPKPQDLKGEAPITPQNSQTSHQPIVEDAQLSSQKSQRSTNSIVDEAPLSSQKSQGSTKAIIIDSKIDIPRSQQISNQEVSNSPIESHLDNESQGSLHNSSLFEGIYEEETNDNLNDADLIDNHLIDDYSYLYEEEDIIEEFEVSQDIESIQQRNVLANESALSSHKSQRSSKPIIEEAPLSSQKSQRSSKPIVEEAPLSSQKSQRSSKPIIEEAPLLSQKSQRSTKPIVEEAPLSSQKSQRSTKSIVDEAPLSSQKSQRSSKPIIEEAPLSSQKSQRSAKPIIEEAPLSSQKSQPLMKPSIEGYVDHFTDVEISFGEEDVFTPLPSSNSNELINTGETFASLEDRYPVSTYISNSIRGTYSSPNSLISSNYTPTLDNEFFEDYSQSQNNDIEISLSPDFRQDSIDIIDVVSKEISNEDPKEYSYTYQTIENNSNVYEQYDSKSNNNMFSKIVDSEISLETLPSESLHLIDNSNLISSNSHYSNPSLENEKGSISFRKESISFEKVTMYHNKVLGNKGNSVSRLDNNPNDSEYTYETISVEDYSYNEDRNVIIGSSQIDIDDHQIDTISYGDGSNPPQNRFINNKTIDRVEPEMESIELPSSEYTNIDENTNDYSYVTLTVEDKIANPKEYHDTDIKPLPSWMPSKELSPSLDKNESIDNHLQKPSTGIHKVDNNPDNDRKMFKEKKQMESHNYSPGLSNPRSRFQDKNRGKSLVNNFINKRNNKQAAINNEKEHSESDYTYETITVDIKPFQPSNFPIEPKRIIKNVEHNTDNDNLSTWSNFKKENEYSNETNPESVQYHFKSDDDQWNRISGIKKNSIPINTKESASMIKNRVSNPIEQQNSVKNSRQRFPIKKESINSAFQTENNLSLESNDIMTKSEDIYGSNSDQIAINSRFDSQQPQLESYTYTYVTDHSHEDVQAKVFGLFESKPERKPRPKRNNKFIQNNKANENSSEIDTDEAILGTNELKTNKANDSQYTYTYESYNITNTNEPPHKSEQIKPARTRNRQVSAYSSDSATWDRH